LIFASTAMTLTGPRPAIAAEGIDRDVEAALRVLYDTVPTAKALAAKTPRESWYSRTSSRPGSSSARSTARGRF